MNLCVFGAASKTIDEKYITPVEEMGEFLAKRGHNLVFGSGCTGEMGAAARGFRRGGGKTHGVIPHFFKQDLHDYVDWNCDEMTYTETMRERKAVMEDTADAFIITPGGAGTFEELFTQIVLMLNEEGLVSLKVQYIDGTKIESVANKYTFVWKGSTEKNKAKLEANVKAVLEAAETALSMENASEQQELTSEEMAERADRILKKMDSEGISDKHLRKGVEKVKTENAPKMKEYEDKLDTLGSRNSYSKTDPDATFMRMKEDAMNNGQTKPGYNVQISTENQFITNYGIFWQPNDQGTLIPYLSSFSDRYGFQSDEICADSGYGSEQNYAHLFGIGVTPYVKYNMFHAEDKRKRRENPFLVQNLYYNPDEDYYVCPMGQHMEHVEDVKSTSDLGYVSTVSKYRAQDCTGCPLRCLCFKGAARQRTIEVNHQNNAYRAEAKRLLTSEKGLHYRSMRPIEPEAVFGDIKFNHGFKRFRLKSNAKVSVEFGLVALAHNLRKYIALGAPGRSVAVGSCL